MAVPALADPVPGATYSGIAADGATVTFTITPDGTLVNSYRITNVRADTCTFTAEGDNGSWEGAPIVNNSFQYNLGQAISLQGTFTGAQSASGTFRLYDQATSSTPACDTGVVSWTATTSSPPPPGNGGQGGNGGGGGGKNGERRFATRVFLHKLSHDRLGGRITSRRKACRAARVVILWRGSRRLARTTSTARGWYAFPKLPGTHGRYVRATVRARTLRSGVCAAASSTFMLA